MILLNTKNGIDFWMLLVEEDYSQIIEEGIKEDKTKRIEFNYKISKEGERFLSNEKIELLPSNIFYAGLILKISEEIYNAVFLPTYMEKYFGYGDTQGERAKHIDERIMGSYGNRFTTKLQSYYASLSFIANHVSARKQYCIIFRRKKPTDVEN